MALEFLVDRSLGRHVVPDAIRAEGFVVWTLFDVYGEAEELLSDVTWLEDAGREDWIVLTGDPRIRRRPHELAVVHDAAVKMFTLPRGNLRAQEQASRFVDNLPRIVAACQRPGPFIYAVLSGRIELRYPRGAAVPGRLEGR